MGYCTFGYNCYNGKQDLYIEILGVIARKMNMEEKASLSLLSVYENISDELLAEAAQFYIYLVTDQDRYLMHWYRKFSDILECGSLSRSIGEFNTVLK